MKTYASTSDWLSMGDSWTLSASRLMYLGSAAVIALSFAPLSIAVPIVFEETAKITAPDPTFRFPTAVAVEGDTIMAAGSRGVGSQIEDHVVYLFQRQSNGAWVYVSTLVQQACDTGEVAEDTCGTSVAIRNGVAVVSSSGQVYVFERSPNGNWIAAPSQGVSGPGDAAVGTGVVLTRETSCLQDTKVFRKSSAGIWMVVDTFPGGFGGCDPWTRVGGDLDISAGNRFVIGNSDITELREASIYEPSATTWTQTATLTSPANGYAFGEHVAIDDSRAFASGTLDTPIHVFNRTPGGWVHSTNIVPPDSAQHSRTPVIEVRDLVVASFDDPHRGGSVGLFQETSSGEYEQVARLVRSDSASQQQGFLVGDAYLSGSFARIAAAGPGGVYVFDLNNWGTTPAPVQEDFQLGNAANWTPMAGSTFSVVASGASRVYRQSSVAGDAGSFVTSIDWTNQAIEADVKPTAFNGTNRWVGLAVRRTDANNNYYITLRQSNVLELKRIVNGAFVTLASTSVPVVLNRNYRLRLEAVGTVLRAYVDGRLALQAHDTALTHGHAGVRMYQARADFDNVILSHNPHLTLLDQRIDRPLELRWSVGPGTWSSVFTNNQRLVQSDTSGDARAVTLVNANDQIVQVRATATSFAGGTGSRWFGVMARYIDANNYYYITVRSDNTISLRKLVNGAIQVLDSAPLTVSTGTSYTLRLEAIGSSLRAYVNGNVVLEANDTSHPSGRYGAVMYKTAATYDDVVTWEP